MSNSIESTTEAPSRGIAENLFAKLDAAFRTREIHLKKIALRPDLLATRLAPVKKDQVIQNSNPSFQA